MSSLPSTLASEVERSILALLGTAGSHALARYVPQARLTLYCWAAVVAARGLPQVFLLRRLSRFLIRAFYSIALRTTLNGLVDSADPGLTLLNLLSLHTLACAVHTDAFGGAALYLLVSSIDAAVSPLGAGALPLLFLAQSLSLAVPVHASFTELCGMCLVQFATQALYSAIPRDQLFLGVVLVLYLSYPFAQLFPSLSGLYAFAIYASTTDMQLQGIPPWLLACGLWLLWRLSTDDVSQRITCVAGGNVLTLLFLTEMDAVLRSDPIPVLLAVMLVIDILRVPFAPAQ